MRRNDQGRKGANTEAIDYAVFPRLTFLEVPYKFLPQKYALSGDAASLFFDSRTGVITPVSLRFDTPAMLAQNSIDRGQGKAAGSRMADGFAVWLPSIQIKSSAIEHTTGGKRRAVIAEKNKERPVPQVCGSGSSLSSFFERPRVEVTRGAIDEDPRLPR